MKEDTAKILGRVKKLFALAGSSNEAEALAATEKAHALLREYNLSISDLPSEKDIGSKLLSEDFKKVRRWKTVLLQGACRTNYCEVITERARNGDRFRVYGRDYNVAGALAIYEYLIEAVDRVALRASSGIRNDFRLGMAFRLRERLEEMMIQESNCRALVPVQHEALKAAREDCPDLGENHSRVSLGLAAQRGRMAADRIPLNRQVGAAEPERLFI